MQIILQMVHLLAMFTMAFQMNQLPNYKWIGYENITFTATDPLIGNWS